MTRPALLCGTAVTTALGLHAWLLLSTPGVHGGGDLTPHLRLVQHMAEAPAIRNVYPPLYHGLGALLAPHVGLSAYAELFAFLSAAAMIAAFRFFQRATRLPDTATALFALSPYGIALSVCLPKVEAAGYAVVSLQVPMLTFEHWGFQLAARDVSAPALRARLEAFTPAVPTRYLNREAVQAAQRWGKELVQDAEDVPVNDQFTLPLPGLYRETLRR